AKEIAEKCDLEVETEVHEGCPAKLMSRLASHEKYSMVALGYSGRSGLLSRVGSVTSKVVRLVDKPVLVLVPSHHNDGPVVGCIDFSEQTDKISYWTQFMAGLQAAEPVYAHVAVPFEMIVAATPNTGGFGLTETVLTRLGGSEEGYVARLEASVRHRLGIEMECEVDILLGNSPSKAISEFARKKNASLVILGRHGHNTLGARIIGSTAEHILEQSHSSVLVLP
ncbi:MAG: universal stress protein, partial [Verrucomicrobiales bacterium]|nr:universal stress protein [Verrucomicrobiales bacterium]